MNLYSLSPLTITQLSIYPTKILFYFDLNMIHSLMEEENKEMDRLNQKFESYLAHLLNYFI